MIKSLKNQRGKSLLMLLSFVLLPVLLHAQGSTIPSIGPIRVEFILFGLTLVGVAIFHKQTMYVALTGLVVVLAFKYIFDPHFDFFQHLAGHGGKEGEWRILVNLMGLLFGFAILAKHFEESKVPEVLPKFLPDDWKGGLVLLFFIFVMSAFLDNIAAAMIGGTIAMVVYKGKVHLGYLAAIIAARYPTCTAYRLFKCCTNIAKPTTIHKGFSLSSIFIFNFISMVVEPHI